MKVIYVRGGSPRAPEVAKLSGMEYGVRHDYTPYASVYMLDIKWDKYDWIDYVSKLKKYHPVMAMVPDYEHKEQRRRLYEQIREVRPLTDNVMVCPKFRGAIDHIPSWCIIGVSVPTTYAGFLPDFRTLKSRRVHLLGGKPEVQADLIRKINGAGADVVSVDLNWHARKAALAQWFDGGIWHDLRRAKVDTVEMEIASGQNIVKYLNNAALLVQPTLI